MAIFADYSYITYTESETETTTEQHTYPENLPEYHPKYSLRGQTETVTEPVVDKETTIIQNAYIVISHYNFYKFEGNEDGEYLLDIQFKVYANKDNYLNDNYDYIYEDDSVGGLTRIESADNLRVKGYEILKGLAHINNIIDD